MLGWIARFHSDPPDLYIALGAHQAEVFAGGRPRRVIVEAAKYQPKRHGATPEFLLIRWCIDGVGVSFERCPSRQAALARLGQTLDSDDIVFSPDPLAAESFPGRPQTSAGEPAAATL